MTDHRHETYDIYGTAATSGDVQHLNSLTAGLRQDLGMAEERIRDLENEIAEIRQRLWDHDHADGVTSDA